jgi:hypothetical protein
MSTTTLRACWWSKPRRVFGDAEDVRPASGDLHHEQDVQPPQGDGVDVEEQA